MFLVCIWLDFQVKFAYAVRLPENLLHCIALHCSYESRDPHHHSPTVWHLVTGAYCSRPCDPSKARKSNVVRVLRDTTPEILLLQKLAWGLLLSIGRKFDIFHRVEQHNNTWRNIWYKDFIQQTRKNCILKSFGIFGELYKKVFHSDSHSDYFDEHANLISKEWNILCCF